MTGTDCGPAELTGPREGHGKLSSSFQPLPQWPVLITDHTFTTMVRCRPTGQPWGPCRSREVGVSGHPTREKLGSSPQENRGAVTRKGQSIPHKQRAADCTLCTIGTELSQCSHRHEANRRLRPGSQTSPKPTQGTVEGERQQEQ